MGNRQTGKDDYDPYDQELARGSDRPVARFGKVALRPAEGESLLIEIDQNTCVEADAFLVEMAGWPGQSGSPVFLRPWEDTSRMSATRPRWEVNFLLGMVQGFYSGGEQDVEIDETSFKLSGLNMGISVVIPAWSIYEALMAESLENRRAIMFEQRAKGKQPRRANSQEVQES